MHSSVAPGASEAGWVQLRALRPGSGSLIETLVRFAVPVLVATKL